MHCDKKNNALKISAAKNFLHFYRFESNFGKFPSEFYFEI